METTFASLLTLAGLGAFHGLNPGMGWLFAVALGMQEAKRSAVWRALIPLTLGHGLAIAAAIGVAMIAGTALSPAMLRWPVAVLLVGLGVRQLYRHLHPRWAAMRVGMGGLTLWSFLMASAHGAGLMVLPVFLSMTAAAQGPSCHARGASTQALAGATATLVHGAGYLAVTALASWVVVDRFGLGLLRKAWINLDVIWAVALILTGCLTSVCLIPSQVQKAIDGGTEDTSVNQTNDMDLCRKWLRSRHLLPSTAGLRNFSLITHSRRPVQALAQAFVDRYVTATDGLETLIPPTADEGLDFVPTHPQAKDALEWMGFEARNASSKFSMKPSPTPRR